MQTYPLTLYYEGACPMCRAEMANLMLRNTRGELQFVDISDPAFDAVPPGLTLDDLLALAHARTADGRIVKGVEVFRLAYAAVGLEWVSFAMRLPVLGGVLDRAYPVLARNRHRLPRRLVAAVFEGPWRRAAERAAAARCDQACHRA
jgi:predicted DCC family thiol-disulfide oxidoreductase YuxK